MDMGKIEFIKEKIKYFMESPWLLLPVILLTGLCYTFNLGMLSLFLSIGICWLVLLTKANLVHFPILLTMFFAGGVFKDEGLGYTIRFDTAWIYIFILISVLALAYAIFLAFKKNHNIFKELAKDKILWAFGILTIPMLLSWINSPVLFDSFYNTIMCLVSPFVYFVIYITVDKTEENKTKMMQSFMGIALLIFLEVVITYFRDFYGTEMSYIVEIVNQKAMYLSWANINVYAALTVISIIASLYYFIRFKDLKNRLFSIIVAGLGIVVVLITNCRSAWFAIVFVGIFFVYSYIYHTKNWKKEIPYFVFFGITLVFLIVFAFSSGLVSEAKSMGLVRTTFAGREDIYRIASHNFLQNFMIGTGIGSSHYYILEGTGRDVYFYHNYILEIASCCGILGLMAFIYYLYVSIKKAWHRDTFSMFVLALTVYMLAHGFFDNLFFTYKIQPYFMLVFPLLGGENTMNLNAEEIKQNE